MTDHVDFDKLAARLFKCDLYQTTTPWDIQDKFNKSAKKSSNRAKKPTTKSAGNRKKEQLKLIATDSLTFDDSGLTREEKRISRQIFLMEQLEESKIPKKIKKQRNLPKLNDKIQWNGLSIADYIHYCSANSNGNYRPTVNSSASGILVDGLTNITNEYSETPLFKPDDDQTMSN
jgi:hypothetical protein